MYLKVRSKKLKKLGLKVGEEKNKLVVKVLKAYGYECDDSQESQIRVNRKIKSEKKKVILKNENEKLSKVGSYYIWEANVTVKIIDEITGEEA